MSGHLPVGRSERCRRTGRGSAGRFLGAALAVVFLGAVDVRANEQEPPVLRPSVGTESPVAKLPVASDVRIVQSGEITRIAFDVTSHLDVRAFVMAEPNRVIVDLPETLFAVDPEAGQKANPRPESEPWRKALRQG